MDEENNIFTFFLKKKVKNCYIHNIFTILSQILSDMMLRVLMLILEKPNSRKKLNNMGRKS